MSIRNMFESIMSEDEDVAGAGEDLSGDGGLVAEDAGTDGADEESGESAQDESEDDLAGLGGLDDGGDELGGFDDEGLGDADGDGEAAAELQHRLDELENEVGSLSSTVNTVRNENEQISESVGEVEENVRKLLDIYEMVTRGVNPFADDVDAGMAGGAMGDEGFGLFADQEGAPSEDSLDGDVAEADAEGFFEDDLGAEDPDDETADHDEEFEEFEDEDATEAGETSFEDEDVEETDGTSFEDLKAEYETEEGDDRENEDDETTAAADDATLGDDDLAAADALAEEDLLESETEADVEGTDTDVADVDGTDAEAADGDAADTTPAAAPAGDRPSKPYLTRLPDGVGTDLIVVEWLEYLVGAAGVRETSRALDYYESIDWIDESVADGLQDYLAGFDDDGGSASLTIDHHTTSLEYIGQLNGGAAEASTLSRLVHGGGTDGVQR